jgi:hypothetical protein
LPSEHISDIDPEQSTLNKKSSSSDVSSVVIAIKLSIPNLAFLMGIGMCSVLTFLLSKQIVFCDKILEVILIKLAILVM